jgi:hypothetical protein
VREKEKEIKRGRGRIGNRRRREERKSKRNKGSEREKKGREVVKEKIKGR